MTHTSTEQERQAPIKMHPGDDLHLTVLMASHGLNFVTGKDREQLLAWGRDVWQAARRVQAVPQGLIDEVVPAIDPAGLDPEKHHCEYALYQDRERIRRALAAAPQPPEANSPGFEGIKTAPQAQEKQ